MRWTTTSLLKRQLFVAVVSTLMVLPAATQGWDFWAVLVNFVRGPLACGPGVPREHHDTCKKCAGPLQQDYCSCKALCDMYDSSSSSHFYNDRAADFCDRMDDIKARSSYTADDYSCSSSSSYGGQTNIQQSSASSASAAASEADGYAGQSSGGVGVVGDMARTFQWWMAGVAAAVIMALVAVVMGQRKDRRDDSNGSGGGGENDRAVLSGAVGRRLGAVAAFAEGVLPTRNRKNRNNNNTKEQVTEMSGYKLDTSDGVGSLHSGSDEENGSLGGYESAYA